jgi:hypothetical protein
MVAAEIERIVEGMRETRIFRAVGDALLSRDRRGGFSVAEERARHMVDARWETRDDRWALAPGKEVISGLSAWSQSGFGVSLGPEHIARAIEGWEFPSELAEVIRAVGSGTRFARRSAQGNGAAR